MWAQNFLNTLPENLSNKITNLVTRQRSIKGWDNRLLGLSHFPIKTIIDVGANEGQSTQKLSSIFPSSNIYVFEPCQLPFQILRRKFSQSPKIKIFNYALGGNTLILTINDYVGATLASSLLTISSEAKKNNPVLQRVKQYPVQQYKLDDLDINLIDEILLKIDVQGYELEVLKGSKITLKHVKACIIEINNVISYENQCSFKDVFTFLDNLGFVYQGNIDQVLDKQGRIEYFDAVFIRI